MEIKLIVDTSAYAAFKRNHQRVVEALLQADQVLVSPIVLGELYFGFRNGSRYEKNVSELNAFVACSPVQIIPINEITADRYSRVVWELKQRGAPIPTNDIWLAAQAMEHGAELLTFDRHFEYVPGLVRTVFES
jgi:tRNA(fMet)-specific endonuclease VapC